jgi:energy-coupling factor transport system substrate-specific component
LGASWVGMGAGLLPAWRGRAEITLLAVYGAVAAYAYGFLINMWFWPFAAGTAGVVGGHPGLQFVPGDAVIDNLRRFFLFTVATSTFGWDTGRAITNVIAVVTIGAPVLAALRRARRRAAFNAPVEFAGPLDGQRPA